MAHRLETADDDERRLSTGGDSDDASGDAPLARRQYVRCSAMAIGAVPAVAGGAFASTDPSGSRERTTGRRLTIDSTGDVTRYELTVDGEFRPGVDASRDADARISGGSTEGIVDDAIRRYRFSGELRDLTVDGDAAIYVGSERIDPDRF